jgi:biopolymer transport protein ExbD
MAAKVGGAKGGKYQLGQNSDMNVTPFVDVMLVLLIIFMVSAPLATLAIKVDLPPNDVNTPTPKREPTVISIGQYGFFVSGKKSDLSTLKSDLVASLQSATPTNETILIRADPNVAYEQFMGVVNQLQVDGFYKVSLIAEGNNA